MNSRKLASVIGALLLCAVAVVVVKKITNGSAQETPETTANHPSLPSGSEDHGKRTLEPNGQGHSSAAGTKPPSVPMTPEAKQAAFNQMHEASITYDPSQLPIIQPYLTNDDPEIRERAVDSMVILGDASASPMLREAAKKLDSSKEMIAMMKAAEYLELPPIDVNKLRERMKNRPKKTPDATKSPRLPHGPAGPPDANHLPQSPATPDEPPKVALPR